MRHASLIHPVKNSSRRRLARLLEPGRRYKLPPCAELAHPALIA